MSFRHQAGGQVSRRELLHTLCEAARTSLLSALVKTIEASSFKSMTNHSGYLEGASLQALKLRTAVQQVIGQFQRLFSLAATAVISSLTLDHRLISSWERDISKQLSAVMVPWLLDGPFHEIIDPTAAKVTCCQGLYDPTCLVGLDGVGSYLSRNGVGRELYLDGVVTHPAVNLSVSQLSSWVHSAGLYNAITHILNPMIRQLAVQTENVLEMQLTSMTPRDSK